jgi:nucleoside-diphosphate-sugar epimerase
MRVLVTGADGYIGSCMTAVLEEYGHRVTGIDTGFYEEGLLYPLLCSKPIGKTDVRDLEAEALSHFDAVVHLAELSNDPLGQMNPDMTMQLNYKGSLDFALRCRESGVSRFLYSSSCSVYGAGTEDWKTEESPADPRTTYALCKTLVEKEVGLLATESFSPVFFRNATAYGISPRMRFDLVLNNLSALAYLNGTVRMISDGTPWRPLIHLRDICHAFAAALDVPREQTRGQILNVGSNEANKRIREIAEVVRRVFKAEEIVYGTADADQRSYRVSFDKISAVLPKFKCETDIEKGAEELLDQFRKINLNQALFEATPYTRVRHLEKLIGRGSLDGNLRWRKL